MRHWKFGPSKADRIFNCLGSYQLTEWLLKKGLIPIDESNTFAEIGTAAHLVASKILKGRDWYDHTYFNTPEEEEYLPVYVDYFTDWTNEYPELEWHFEQIVNPAKYVKTNHCKGTSDGIGISVKDKLIIVADLKFGEHVVVEPEDNLQGILYALGALAKLEKAGHKVKDYRIIIAIIQPRAYHVNGPIREWETSYRELMRWGQWVKKRVPLVMSQNPQFTPDPDNQCRFCPCQGRCDALAEYELSIAREAFTMIEDPDAEYKEVGALTNKQISHLLKEFPGLRRWITSVSITALASLENGARIPYWGLKEKLGFREWDVAVEELELYFDRDVLYEEKLRSPAQVEKLAGKNSVEGFIKREVKGNTIIETNDPSDADESMIFDEVETENG